MCSSFVGVVFVRLLLPPISKELWRWFYFPLLIYGSRRTFLSNCKCIGENIWKKICLNKNFFSINRVIVMVLMFGREYVTSFYGNKNTHRWMKNMHTCILGSIEGFVFSIIIILQFKRGEEERRGRKGGWHDVYINRPYIAGFAHYNNQQ